MTNEEARAKIIDWMVVSGTMLTEDDISYFTSLIEVAYQQGKVDSSNEHIKRFEEFSKRLSEKL